MKLTQPQITILRDIDGPAGSWLSLDPMPASQRATVYRLVARGLVRVDSGRAQLTNYGRAVLDHKS